jgi:hypothetical protein
MVKLKSPHANCGLVSKIFPFPAPTKLTYLSVFKYKKIHKAVQPRASMILFLLRDDPFFGLNDSTDSPLPEVLVT